MDQDFSLLDDLNNKKTFTLKSAFINNSYHLSNPDHFILCQPMNPMTMTIPEFKIFENVANMNDYNAINLKFLVLKSKAKYESKISLKNFLGQIYYKWIISKEVDFFLYSTFNQIIDANFLIISVNQETINSTFFHKFNSKISSVFKTAAISTQQF